MADPLITFRLRNRIRFGPKLRYRRPGKWLFPRNAERAQERRLIALVDVVETQYKSLIYPHLQRMAEEARLSRGDGRTTRRRDAWSDDLESLLDGLRARLSPDRLAERRAVASQSAGEISEFNQGQWRRIVKTTVGIDLYTAEPWLREELRSWSQETSALISTLEDDAVRQIGIWTNRGLRQGWHWKEIAKNIEDRFEVSRKRARFIARDQTAKLNGTLTHRRQSAAGITHYFWRDSRDERVRGNPSGKYPGAKPSHWARNGQRFAWASPPEGGHPGMDYNCRCTAEPDMRGLLEALKE